MAKRIVFICLWTVVLYFGSAMLLGYASGLYFAMSRFAGQQPRPQTISWLGSLWVYVPMILGPLGLVLGIFGFLPGTHRQD